MAKRKTKPAKPPEKIKVHDRFKDHNGNVWQVENVIDWSSAPYSTHSWCTARIKDEYKSRYIDHSHLLKMERLTPSKVPVGFAVAEKDMVVWKKVKGPSYKTKPSDPRSWNHDEYLVKMTIPKGTAYHHGCHVGEGKMRAARAVVNQFYKFHYRLNCDPYKGKTYKPAKGYLYSNRSVRFKYIIGATVKPTKRFSMKPNRCDSGIHFFMTAKEAMEYDWT